MLFEKNGDRKKSFAAFLTHYRPENIHENNIAAI